MYEDHQSLRGHYPDDVDEPAEKPVGRRKLIASLMGGGLGAAALGAAVFMDESVSGQATAGAARDLPDGPGEHVPAAPPPSSGAQPKRKPAGAPVRPKDAGAFDDRDVSYVRGEGKPAKQPPKLPDTGETEAEIRVPAVPKSEKQAVDAADLDGAATSVRSVMGESASLLDWSPAAHLLRRFSFGPTPEMVDEVRRSGMTRWFLRQLTPKRIDDAEADRVWRAYPSADMSIAQVRAAYKAGDQTAMREYGQAVLGRQLWSNRQVFEVMVDLFANHLNMAMPSERSWDSGNSYHNDVIRKHALGSFRDMLQDAMRHPAMLRYLSNDLSHKDSVNENLGRELLELHTIGVNGGYTETDVRNSAYILTGRTVDKNGEFFYDPKRHWTGEVTVLDFADANDDAERGLEVGDRYLDYLATHPATATMVARKLAVRFVSDDPAPSLVDRLAKTYLATGTSVVAMLAVLVCSPEFWVSVGAKTRRPLENVTAAVRTLGVKAGGDPKKGVARIYDTLAKVGHRPLNWQPPNGYPDVAGAWASAGSMLQIWNLHRTLVRGTWPDLVHVAPDKLHGDGVPADADAYIDTLCARLLHQKFTAAHHGALREFLGERAGSGADALTMAGHLAALVLDSPYFALR